MSVHLEIVDHDQLYAKSTSELIIINHFDLSSQAQLEQLNEQIYTTYDDDSLEVLPTCEGSGPGHLKGEYNVGLRCPECGTLCLPITERPLESTLWIAAPEGVRALINPNIWMILSRRFMDGGVSVLDWLTDPKLVVPAEKKPHSIRKLEAKKVPRGINYFYDNFDEIIDLLINGKIIKNGKWSERVELLMFLQENRNAIFSQHIPVPSKIAFITENTPMGTYADPTMAPAMDAVRTISSIENSVTPLDIKARQSRTIHAISKLAEYYENFYSKSLGPKSGWFRKHIYGSRVHFSFRAVITSLSEPHNYDEVHLPWSMSVNFLRLHLISKLLDRNFSPNEAIKHLNEHTLKYSALLDEIFHELIADSPIGGIPIILQRNPSLTRGSAQQLRVTKVKTDVAVNTISLSVLILKSFNADFDGDQLNGLLIHDAKTLKRLSRLKPHLYAMDLNRPRALSGFMALPGPVVGTIANWIHHDQ